MRAMVWESRFEGRAPVSILENFNSSIAADMFLFGAELRASSAYARGLATAGLLTRKELAAILGGLAAIEERGRNPEAFRPFEDVHSAVELLLIEEIGEAGKKLHTGRSRNEQVATDERLYLKDEIPALIGAAASVQRALVGLAEQNIEIVMPGYSHLQRGQPILFAHYVLSFFWAVERGKERLRDALRRVDVLPLGSGALAGSTVPLDREELRKLLGFAEISENSYDVVGDRGFVLETLFALALLLLDLSRLAEDFVLFATAEFGFLEFDPSLATSSSLMPQKKNPDVFELVRAAPGRLFGRLAQLFLAVKGLPSSYNKDLQEDKKPLREGVEDARLVLAAAAASLERVRPNRERMRAAVAPNLFAADLADVLVDRGVPFRDAHAAAASAVRIAEEKGGDIASLTADEWAAIHPLFGKIPEDIFDPLASIRRKKTSGSTHPDKVRLQIERAKVLLT
ncbi:MAG: argininosuccinate lyase [Candidatus Aminicenantes bacterium]|nr:argininosuccinate lyase [Candidatus Aminicenantes bacterium]